MVNLADLLDGPIDQSEYSKVKRATNRELSPQRLSESGIKFETRNKGAHLIVTHDMCIVDFWPGTGLWIVRGPKNQRGRGVFRLITWLRSRSR